MVASRESEIQEQQHPQTYAGRILDRRRQEGARRPERLDGGSYQQHARETDHERYGIGSGLAQRRAAPRPSRRDQRVTELESGGSRHTKRAQTEPAMGGRE